MRGWQVTIWISVALVALTALQLAVWGREEEGIRVVVRSSARSSVLLFALAFSARALRSLWSRPTTKWLLVNRRYLGVSYAVSHAVHALALHHRFGDAKLIDAIAQGHGVLLDGEILPLADLFLAQTDAEFELIADIRAADG